MKYTFGYYGEIIALKDLTLNSNNKYIKLYQEIKERNGIYNTKEEAEEAAKKLNDIHEKLMNASLWTDKCGW